ncbi:MAG: hypothetical protein AAFN94_02380 [Pseudomonadota bacterium]
MKPIIYTTAFLTSTTVALASMDIKEIDVSVALDDIENSAATEVWKSVETDLEAAIALRLVNQIADAGADISVNLDEVALASNFANATNMAQAELSGRVIVMTDDNVMAENYRLTVLAEDVIARDPVSGDAVAVPIPADTIYQAMIDGFADNVAGKVK